MKNVYSSYSWIRGDYNTTATEADLLNINTQLEATLKKISKDAKTFYRATSEYFPHVGTSSLQQGFYKKFDAIQGVRGLYYATTLLGFETMDGALKMTEAFVNRYF